MKLPKFIKNSTHQERQQNLLKSNRQLMLTDHAFRFQPQKLSQSAALFKDILNTSKQINSNESVIDQDSCNTAMLKTPSTPFNDLYQFKTSKLYESNPITSNSQTTGRYVKCAQPKRLQRNRLGHVSQKPACYESRSDLLFNIYDTTNLTPSCTPIGPSMKNNSLFLSSKSNGRKINTDDDDEDTEDATTDIENVNENLNTNLKLQLVATPNQTTTTTPKTKIESLKESSSKQTESVNTQTPNSTSNRFSFSKLTKFVSRSALKVINRKSIGSNASEASSPDTSSSASSSTSMLTDDDELVSNNCRNVRYCPAIVKQIDQSEPKFNQNIYTSLQQQKEIEEKINRGMIRPGQMNRSCRAGQPSMGITSTMLKQLKKQSFNNNLNTNAYQYGITTGISALPNSYLIGVPIVFNTETLKEDIKPQNEKTYDRLNRQPIPFLGETIPNKKMSKPIVKSLSSISAALNTISMPSTKLNTYKSSTIAPTSPLLPNNNSCRISVFSSAKINSSNKLEQQLHYESFSEAIF